MRYFFLRSLRYVGAISVVFVLGFFIFSSAALASSSRAPEIKIYSSGDRKLERTFFAYDKGFNGGVNVTVANVDRDSKQEIITAPAFGGSPHVRAYNMDGSFAGFSHMVFDPRYKRGVTVAAGDVDGDGKDEIVVGQALEQARVKVYRTNGKIISEFLAFPKDYTHGVSLAVGDLNGDGKAEIIAGTRSGSRAQVRAFNATGKFLGLNIFPFPEGFRGGLSLATLDVDGDHKDEIAVAAESGGPAQILIYRTDGTNKILSNFLAFPKSHKGGAHIAAGDLNSDGKEEIIAGIGGLGGPQIRAFDVRGKAQLINMFTYEKDFNGGVAVAIGDLDNDKTLDIITAPSRFLQPFEIQDKHIDINLHEQRLYAYEGNIVKNTFLISSGVRKHPSPEGKFRILEKVPVKRYKYSYGPNHPDNYDLPNVKYNSRVTGPYWIHGTYWHNNFGRPMSHGCFNAPNNQAAWIYSWADIGTPVSVHR